MPYAVTHMLVALIVASIIRQFYIKRYGNAKFPLHYVLLAGLGGIIPDLDLMAYWVLYFFGYSIEEIHRTFSHTIFIPLIFLGLAFVFKKYKNYEFSKHHMTLRMIFLMLSLGSFIHLALDVSLAGQVALFYPITSFSIGFSITQLFPEELRWLFFPCLDAALLVIWMIYMELTHKISRFL